MTITMDRPTEITSEHNHSCTSQCPQPCPYKTSEVDPITAPVMTAAE